MAFADVAHAVPCDAVVFDRHARRTACTSSGVAVMGVAIATLALTSQFTQLAQIMRVTLGLRHTDQT